MNGELLSLRALVSLAFVLGLLGVSIWALRRGAFKLPALKNRASIVIETATSLGDRRSLAIVTVEGRRLLIGLTPGSVSLIADLQSASGAADGRPGRA